MMQDPSTTRARPTGQRPSASPSRARRPEQDLLLDTEADLGLPPLSKPTNRCPRQMREERQARVGILRNLVKPSLPPAKRVPLTGRWMKMQSSRRPKQSPSDGFGADGDKEGAPKRSFAQIVEEAEGHGKRGGQTAS